MAEVEQYNPGLQAFLTYDEPPASLNLSRNINLGFFMDGSDWFIDEEASGGIILDAMIHDINLLVCKYEKPTLLKGEFKQIKCNCIDEVTVTLQFNGFIATIHCSWLSTLKQPIETTINIGKKNGETLSIHVDDYIIRDQTTAKDGFYYEIKAFLEAISTNKAPYALSHYLVGIEVAHEMIALAKRKPNSDNLQITQYQNVKTLFNPENYTPLVLPDQPTLNNQIDIKRTHKPGG